jgi:Ca2+-binding EF-hand superfamily protein
MLIPDLAVNPLATRIIDVILLDENDPSQSLEEINFRQFVKVLACFRKISPSQSHQANSVDKKLEFIFKIYDKDGDGKISKDDLSHILSCLVGLNIPQEQVNQIVSRTMKEADLDKDNHLDFEEFKRALGDVEIGDKMSFQFSRTI